MHFSSDVGHFALLTDSFPVKFSGLIFVSSQVRICKAFFAPADPVDFLTHSNARGPRFCVLL